MNIYECSIVCVFPCTIILIPNTFFAAPGKTPQRPSSVLKPSGSSFGLHSPDNLPLNLQAREDDIRALIRQLEDNSGLPYTFAEGTLYLDPDIIDLTMIPPPITPEEVRLDLYVWNGLG